VQHGDVPGGLEHHGEHLVDAQHVGLAELRPQVVVGDAGAAEVVLEHLGAPHQQQRFVVDDLLQSRGLPEARDRPLRGEQHRERDQPVAQRDVVERDGGDEGPDGDGHGEIEARHLREAPQPDDPRPSDRGEVDRHPGDEDGGHLDPRRAELLQDLLHGGLSSRRSSGTRR